MISEILKAVKYRNLDEARHVLREMVGQDSDKDIFDDGGEEPQGLLAIIPSDRLPEEQFYRLFEAKKGIVIEVEKISFSGYGPPAEDQDYMGFVREKIAYVLKGCRLPVEIENCPYGAQDIHHLEALVMDHQHPLNRQRLAKELHLEESWDFEELFELILQGRCTAQEIDRLIHKGIH